MKYPLLLLLLLVIPGIALAQDFGLSGAVRNTGLTEVPVEILAANIISIILGFIGIVFLLLVIYAGFLWMVGGREGNEESIKKAKSLLSGATIGLLIILAAYSITYYITLYLLEANQYPTQDLSEPITPPTPPGPQP